LDEASDGLEAAARLSEQLDRKEEAIDALREEGGFILTGFSTYPYASITHLPVFNNFASLQ